MMAACCLAHLLVAKLALPALCMLVAAVVASLVAVLRCAAVQRLGILEQLWSLYGSLREERLIVRVGDPGYQTATVRACAVYLLCWCERIVLAPVLKYYLGGSEVPGPWRHVATSPALTLAMVAAAHPRLSDVKPTATAAPGCGLFRPRAAGPPE